MAVEIIQHDQNRSDYCCRYWCTDGRPRSQLTIGHIEGEHNTALYFTAFNHTVCNMSCLHMQGYYSQYFSQLSARFDLARLTAKKCIILFHISHTSYTACYKHVFEGTCLISHHSGPDTNEAEPHILFYYSMLKKKSRIELLAVLYFYFYFYSKSPASSSNQIP